MSWESSEENAKQRANLGRYFKLSDDGDQARLVLLTEPDEQEKEGSNGPYTVYSVDVWNVDGCKLQTWDMGSAQFKSLLGMKRALGLARLYASELIVVRNGRKGDTSTTYTWTADGAITQDTLDAMADKGVAPSRQSGGATTSSSSTSKPAQRQASKTAPTAQQLEGGMVLATSLDELRQAFEQAWQDADGHGEVQAELQATYYNCKSKLEQPPKTAKRAPAF